MHLGENASLDDILLKLERVYGTVESGTTLLQQFYNCRQEDGESIGAFSCRLEDILSKAIERGSIDRAQCDPMLKNKLWSGLRDERVRNATRYKLDQISSFDVLVCELRATEQEIKELDSLKGKPLKATRPINMVQAESPNSRDDLLKRVKDIEDRMSKQQDTTQLLGKILAKIELLEQGKTSSIRNERESNFAGPLKRDNQRAYNKNN